MLHPPSDPSDGRTAREQISTSLSLGKLTRCEHREPRRRAAAALWTERFSQQHVRCFTMVYWTAKKDKASLLANNNQTAALASFVGGFASYGLAGARPYCDETICLVMYVLCLFAVHASFCSALTSALLHRVISNMDEEDVLKGRSVHPSSLFSNCHCTSSFWAASPFSPTCSWRAGTSCKIKKGRGGLLGSVSARPRCPR